MKNCFSGSFILILTGALVLTICSGCEVYYVSRPQPIDSPDEAVFPKQLRGDWMDEDSMLFSVTKERIQFVIAEDEYVYKGFRHAEQNEGLYNLQSYYTIHYNAAGEPVDTVPNYVEHGGLIFRADHSDMLGKGYPYINMQDTIRILRKDTFSYALNVNTFLRKAGEDTYCLNLKGQTEQETGWYNFYVIRLSGRDTVRLYTPSDKMKQIPEVVHRPDEDEKSKIVFFDPYWSRAEIMRMTADGSLKSSGPMIRQH